MSSKQTAKSPAEPAGDNNTVSSAGRSSRGNSPAKAGPPLVGVQGKWQNSFSWNLSSIFFPHSCLSLSCVPYPVCFLLFHSFKKLTLILFPFFPSLLPKLFMNSVMKLYLQTYQVTSCSIYSIVQFGHLLYIWWKPQLNHNTLITNPKLSLPSFQDPNAQDLTQVSHP